MSATARFPHAATKRLRTHIPFITNTPIVTNVLPIPSLSSGVSSSSSLLHPRPGASVSTSGSSASRFSSASAFWSSHPVVPPPWTKYKKPITLQPIVPYKPRTVPPEIRRPPYAQPGFNSDPRHSQYTGSSIEIKDAAGIAGMRHAGELASYIRAFAGSCVEVGRTTDEIDAMVHEECCRIGSYPSPLHYAGFPKSICTSVNQVVVHGIPDGRKLEDGDIINIDVSVYGPEGYHGDCSGMFVAGKTDPLALKLIETTRSVLDGAIALCRPGVPFNTIGAYIEPKVKAAGYSIVKIYCGHGIGSNFHIPPLVYHHRNDVTALMQPGMTFTIEPIVNEGTDEIEMLNDNWTWITRDGGRSAQFEETLLITEDGCEILTKHTRPLPNKK